MKKNESSLHSRRSFISNASLLVGATLGANKVFGMPAIISDLYKTSSLIKGVQIGVITYSFRDMPDQSAEATLQYILDSGMSATELMGDPAETYAGKPKNPVDLRSIFPLRRKKRDNLPLTEEETKKLNDADALVKEYNAEVKKWRLSVPMSKFEEVGKMYKKAGVKIYGFKPNAFEKDN
jgi:hypothetical protein